MSESIIVNQLKPPFLLVLVLALVGFALLYGGMELLLLGGSLYYLCSGLAILLVAWMSWNRNPAAVVSYLVLLISTVIWSIYEVGYDVWALIPRIVAPTFFAGLFLLPVYRRKLKVNRLIYLMTITVMLVAMALLAFSYSITRYTPQSINFTKENLSRHEEGLIHNWSSLGGTDTGSKHIDAAQIHRGNLSELELAWTYKISQEVDSEVTLGSVTPLSINGRLYFCASNNLLITLDADTGEEIWRYDPHTDLEHVPYKTCRGVAYHTSKERKNMACRSRILAGTLDNRLLAVDAQTGAVCDDFGRDGFVDLNAGLGNILPGYRYVTSPPTVLGDVAVVGGFVFDNQSTDEPSGVVKGFDVETGDLLWAWDFLSPKGISWDSSMPNFPKNTPNFWSLGIGDADLGLVYLPTGNTPPDFYGGHRTPAQDRYGSSVVALDVTTGDLRWSFQTVHHDLWDYDVPAQPIFVEWGSGAEQIPALILATKRGEIFILDRRNGEPLTSVVERLVPQGNLPNGEWTSKTQPFSVGFPSFAPDDLSEKSMWGATPLDQLWCRIRFLGSRYEGKFTPQSEQGALNYPGNFGVFNWGGMSLDTRRGVLVVNASYFPWYLQLIKRPKADRLGIVPYGEPSTPPELRTGGSEIYYAQAGTPYAVDSRPFTSPLGYPCHQPPWGELAAIDLASRTIIWRRPLGTTEDVAPFGLPLPTGVFNIGGAITTSSGLIFIGAAIDDYIRAFDVNTGEELWKSRLPAGGQATPVSYVTPSGRQFVVISAGGHGALATKLGDYIVAYALPRP